MPSNQKFELNILNNNQQYVPIYLQSTSSQVLDWNIGEVYGPYSFVLPATNWTSANSQAITLNGVTSNDVLNCINVLTGTQSQMQQQVEAYKLLDPNTGIQSSNNQIIFTCTNQSPTVDLQVQVWWTR